MHIREHPPAGFAMQIRRNRPSQPPCKCVHTKSGHAIRPRMSRATERTTANHRSPIKPPARCPACNSRRVAPRGSRAKKLETVRLYRCGACRRTFTSGPRALRNKTYPLHEILDALSTYNRGYTLDETSRRLSSRHSHTINPATISRWLAAHPGLTTYRRLRERGLKLFTPPQPSARAKNDPPVLSKNDPGGL